MVVWLQSDLQPQLNANHSSWAVVASKHAQRWLDISLLAPLVAEI